jgi:predicted transcriptional regulator
MATKNPRISVMLKPETDAVLTRLSVATKQSKSSIIAEFLEDACMPMFERMVVVLEAAANATDEAKAAAKQGFADAEEKLLNVMGMTTDLFDVASQPILQSAEKATDQTGRAGRAAARAAGLEPARPPHVTRGSGTPNTRTKTDISPMKTGLSVPSHEESPSKRVKRPSKALKPKVGG